MKAIKLTRDQANKLRLSSTKRGVAICKPRGNYYNNRGTAIK